MAKEPFENKELIDGTLKYMAKKSYKPWGSGGFVDVRVHWCKIGLPKKYWEIVQQVIVISALARVGYGRPYDLELTSEAYKYLNGEQNHAPKSLDKKFELEDTTPRGRTNRIYRASFYFLTQMLGKKFIDNVWWQLIVGGVVVVIAGEYAKLLFQYLHWLPHFHHK